MEHFTVPLQDPFAFKALWWVLAGLLLLCGVAAFFLAKRYRLAREKKAAQTPPPETLAAIKNRYLDDLNALYTDYAETALDDRACYIALSGLVRGFVSETTGIDVETCTLQEISRMKLPQLTQLVSECYEPEFAERTAPVNPAATVKRAAHIISRWL